MSEWQDIASAPKDGREALVGCWVIDDDGEQSAYWSAWVVTLDGSDPGCDGAWGDPATHYADMPAPPPFPARKGE